MYLCAILFCVASSKFARGSAVQNCSGLRRDLTIIVWGDCCSSCNLLCCYFIIYCPTPSGCRVSVLLNSALIVLEGGVVDVSCCVVFVGVAVATTVAMGPSVFPVLSWRFLFPLPFTLLCCCPPPLPPFVFMRFSRLWMMLVRAVIWMMMEVLDCVEFSIWESCYVMASPFLSLVLISSTCAVSSACFDAFLA